MPRLDILLARNLGWPRSAAREAIAEGRVRNAHGEPFTNDRADVATPLPIVVDDEPVELWDVAYVLQHKPTGCVTALQDTRHPTAYALLDGAPLHAELRPVGRLDLDTSGLLLWTTDGQWLQRLTHPKRAVPRTYHAALAGPFSTPPPNLELDDGHRPNIQALASLAASDAHPALARPPETTVLASITIVGGAYHEVRRIFAALGSHVLGLCRVSYGKLALPADLQPGDFRLIGADEV
jgi:16S rRNA pseudouridine516 synthase